MDAFLAQFRLVDILGYSAPGVLLLAVLGLLSPSDAVLLYRTISEFPSFAGLVLAGILVFVVGHVISSIGYKCLNKFWSDYDEAKWKRSRERYARVIAREYKDVIGTELGLLTFDDQYCVFNAIARSGKASFVADRVYAMIYMRAGCCFVAFVGFVAHLPFALIAGSGVSLATSLISGFVMITLALLSKDAEQTMWEEVASACVAEMSTRERKSSLFS